MVRQQQGEAGSASTKREPFVCCSFRIVQACLFGLAIVVFLVIVITDKGGN